MRWWAFFVVTQVVAFFVVLALDPAGFDSCDQANAGHRLGQAVIAGVSIVGLLALAIWRLRRWSLAVAVVAVALSTLGWIWLLGSEQSC